MQLIILHQSEVKEGILAKCKRAIDIGGGGGGARTQAEFELARAITLT